MMAKLMAGAKPIAGSSQLRGACPPSHDARTPPGRDEHRGIAPRTVASCCRSVLMVGTDLGGMGGIRAVVRGYIEAGVFDRIDCAYVATHRFGSRWTKVKAALGGWIGAARGLRELDAPLVHVHVSIGASFWRKSVICLLARLAGRPYLLHVHGDFDGFYEQCSRPARRIVRAIIGRAALVLAVCDAWRTTLERICPQALVEVLPNAVALPPHDHRAPPMDAQPTLFFLGDLIRTKGIYDLAHAFARIARRFPRLKLVYAGAGELEEVRRLARGLGLADRIECIGWLEARRKQAELAGATIFVLPSHLEGMPMSLLEAMASGLPVIATSVGGVPEVIDPEANGLMVPPGDIDALAAAIARLMSEPGLRGRLGQAARETIASRFTLAATVERLIGIYRRFGIAAREPQAADGGPER